MRNNQQSTIDNHQSDEYLCLVVRNEEYGVKTSHVKEILDTPVIRQVPKAPPFVAGVANIRGRIVPLLNPMKRFGLPSITNHQLPINNRLVLVQLENSLYGIIVDRIASISYVTEAMIEPVNPIMVDKEAAFITGMAKDGERLIHLLDLEAFIRAGLDADQEDIAAYEAFAAHLNTTLERAKKQSFRRFLSLVAADEKYGVDLSVLHEVIPIQQMEQIDTGPEYVAGIIKTRWGILPVVDLQKKFDLDPVPYLENSRVVVIDAKGYNCGLLANSVTEILSIAPEEMKEAPVIASTAKSPHIKSVAILEEGKRLMILLDESRVLNHEETKTLKNMKDVKMFRKTQKKKTVKEEEGLTFVTFNVSDVEFAFSLQELSEVIHYKEPTRIPKAPRFVRGIVAVRGELTPVVDLRERFDLSGTEKTTSSRIMVIKKGKARYGIMADSISEIVKVSPEELSPPPPIVKGITSTFMDKIIQLKESDRTPIVLNIEAIMAE